MKGEGGLADGDCVMRAEGCQAAVLLSKAVSVCGWFGHPEEVSGMRLDNVWNRIIKART
jgi:hypothetical protein